MSKIWYISPSCQKANIGAGDYGSEMEQMYLLAYEITPHLDRAGVSFIVPERNMDLTGRCKESNEVGAYFHIALHSNAGGKGLARGPVALYYSEKGKIMGGKLVAALLALGQESNRSSHLVEQKNLYELKKTKAPAVLLEVDFHDSVDGVEFITNRRHEIAEAIARIIIQEDGKDFVPETSSAKTEEAVNLGLFPSQTDWKSPLSKEEAAGLAVDLLAIMERG